MRYALPTSMVERNRTPRRRTNGDAWHQASAGDESPRRALRPCGMHDLAVPNLAMPNLAMPNLAMPDAAVRFYAAITNRWAVRRE